jgi:hypothetical protein
MRLLSAPDEPSMAGLVEVNQVTTIAGLRCQLSVGIAHGRESPRHDHQAFTSLFLVLVQTILYAGATGTIAFLQI